MIWTTLSKSLFLQNFTHWKRKEDACKSRVQPTCMLISVPLFIYFPHFQTCLWTIEYQLRIFFHSYLLLYCIQYMSIPWTRFWLPGAYSLVLTLTFVYRYLYLFLKFLTILVEAEIQERVEFLEDMKKMGKERQYKAIIGTEISMVCYYETVMII